MEKPVVISVSALVTGYNDISKVIEKVSTAISVDGRVPHWVKERGTIEDAINEALETATIDEEEAAKTIRRAMGEKLEAGVTRQEIHYFANDTPVPKTKELAPYLTEGNIEVRPGVSHPIEQADIRIDKTYWMGKGR